MITEIFGILIIEFAQNAPAWLAIYLLRRYRYWGQFTALMVLSALTIELTEPLKMELAGITPAIPSPTAATITFVIFFIAGTVAYLYLKYTDRWYKSFWIDLGVVALIGFAIGISQSGHNLVHAISLGLAGMLTITALRRYNPKLMFAGWFLSAILIATFDVIIPYVL